MLQLVCSAAQLRKTGSAASARGHSPKGRELHCNLAAGASAAVSGASVEPSLALPSMGSAGSSQGQLSACRLLAKGSDSLLLASSRGSWGLM